MSNFKLINDCETYTFKIHMAGDYNHARQLCRKFVMVGACVQLTKCQYIYTGGLEDGFIVSLINYPRFERTEEYIRNQAKDLAEYLAFELCQKSYTIEGKDKTYYFESTTYKKE